MHLDRRTGLAQSLGNVFAPKATINEEYQPDFWLGRHAAKGSWLRTTSSISARDRP